MSCPMTSVLLATKSHFSAAEYKMETRLCSLSSFAFVVVESPSEAGMMTLGKSCEIGWTVGNAWLALDAVRVESV